MSGELTIRELMTQLTAHDVDPDLPARVAVQTGPGGYVILGIESVQVSKRSRIRGVEVDGLHVVTEPLKLLIRPTRGAD